MMELRSYTALCLGFGEKSKDQKDGNSTAGKNKEIDSLSFGSLFISA